MLKVIIYLLIYGVISALGLALFKLSLAALPGFSPSQCLGLARDWRFLVGFTLYALGFVMWLVLLQRYDLTLVFPIATGSLFAAVTVLGIFMLHEPFNLGRVLGMVVICIGVGVLAWSR